MSPAATARDGASPEPVSQSAEDRTRLLVAITAILIALRFLSGFLPLAHDEAYYWLWSTDLGAGYFDHPPAAAFLIRAGTTLFGPSVIGIRFAGLLIAIPATLCVARSGQLVAGRREDGARAAVFFNAALMVNAQTVMQGPDDPALFCAAAFLWTLLELARSRHPAWWLAAGLAGGLGLLSKYTIFILGLGALLWLVWCKDARGWLRTPWPWAGGLLAALVFFPNLWWNATHGWPSLSLQFGRLAGGDTCSGSGCRIPGLELLQFVQRQMLMLSPVLAVLAAAGVWRAAGRTADPSRRLIAALVLPALILFTLQSFRAHLLDNWPSFLYPALAVAAADAFRHLRWPKLVRASALPVALIILAGPYLQTAIALSGFGGRNLMGNFAFDMPSISAAVAEQAKAVGARAILTATYPTTAWLRFYGPSDLPVIEFDDDFHYPDAVAATAADLAGTLLFVDERSEADPNVMAELRAHFAEIRQVYTALRRGTRSRFTIYAVTGFGGTPIGRIPFPPR